MPASNTPAARPSRRRCSTSWPSEFPKESAKVRFGTKEKNDAWCKQLETIGAPSRDLPVQVGIGFKPVSYLGTERLVHSAIGYAIENGRKSVTLVHKGNIMKFTEGGVSRLGLPGGPRVLSAPSRSTAAPGAASPRASPGGGIDHQGRDRRRHPAADPHARLPSTTWSPRSNLNGDYISDALAACVGGIGIAPGANINYVTGHAIFEATHGTAPKYAGQDKVNPGSVILSGEMMLRYLGWNEAADLIIRGMEGAIAAKTVTYDFARMMGGAKEVKCSEFGAAVVKHMG